MSRKPENTFIASIHKHLPHELYRIKNNNVYNSGQPDCWYSGPGGDLWIEYKFVEVPKRITTEVTIDLTKLQQHWLASRHAEGRQVGVIVGCKEGGVWLPGVTWQMPLTTRAFKGTMRTREELAAVIVSLTT